MIAVVVVVAVVVAVVVTVVVVVVVAVGQVDAWQALRVSMPFNDVYAGRGRDGSTR